LHKNEASILNEPLDYFDVGIGVEDSEMGGGWGRGVNKDDEGTELEEIVEE
jgi:hypothetical protein